MVSLISNRTLTNGTEPVSESHKAVILTALYSGIFALSICGNGAMLAVLYKRFRRKSPSDFLLLNMVISETTVVGICVPIDLIILHQTNEKWIFGKVLCKIIWPLQTLPYGVLVWTLMLISIERFKIVAFPLRKKSNWKKHIFIVVLTWLVSSLTVTPLATTLKMEDGNCVETWSSQYRRAYTLFLFISQYAIPLIIIAVCYTVIGYKMQQTSKEMKQHISGRNRALSRRSRRQKLLVRMIALFVVVFAICMLPHHVVWLLNDFGLIQTSEDFLTFAYVFTFTSTLANPVIYFTHNSGFKKDLMKIFCSCSEGFAANNGSYGAVTSASRFSTVV